MVFISYNINIVFLTKPVFAIDIILRVPEAFEKGVMGPLCTLKQLGNVGQDKIKIMWINHPKSHEKKCSIDQYVV